MNISDVAKKVSTGIGLFQKVSAPGSVDDIKLRTAIAANVWALNYGGIEEEPFPSAGQDDLVLSDSFDIPEDGWGRVWFQRQFWLEHSSGIKSRWINGRLEPQEILRL